MKKLMTAALAGLMTLGLFAQGAPQTKPEGTANPAQTNVVHKKMNHKGWQKTKTANPKAPKPIK